MADEVDGSEGGEARTFRTSTGTCRVTDDRIELERSGWRGWFASTFIGESIGRAMIWYLVAGVGLVGWGLYDLLVLGTKLGWLPLSFGVIALVNVAFSRDASAATRIDRSTVEHVVPEPPTFPVRRGHFMVYFEREGETRRRVIMMPGFLDDGGDEYERAREIFDAEGLLDRPE